MDRFEEKRLKAIEEEKKELEEFKLKQEKKYKRWKIIDTIFEIVLECLFCAVVLGGLWAVTQGDYKAGLTCAYVVLIRLINENLYNKKRQD